MIETHSELTTRFPILASELHQWIPHRPPMVWIDQVNSVTPQNGECQVTLRESGHYMAPDGLRPSSMVEFIAQSYGFTRAAQHLLGCLKGTHIPTQVFLVGIREGHFFSDVSDIPILGPGSILIIKTFNTREIGPLTLFDGHITSANGIQLFEAKLKVYSA